MLSFNDVLDLPAYRPPPEGEETTSSWPKGAERRSYWGQEILWWPRERGGNHWSAEELEHYRNVGDPLVDDVLVALEMEGRPLGPGDDLLRFAEAACSKTGPTSPAEAAARRFWTEATTRVPSWVNEDALRRGQEVFAAHAPAASLALYYRSLVPGFSIPRIAAVVRATGYLSPPGRPDQALRRLLDTGELTAACVGLGVETLRPGGVGREICLRVRALHAKVRRGLSNKKGAYEHGVPINQEDSAATLLAFAVNVLIGVDFVSGVPLSRQEREDYLALWRYLGWLLGVHTADEDHDVAGSLPPLDPCGPGRGGDVVRHSNDLFQSIIVHLMGPDDTSVEISHHLLKITDRRPPKGGASLLSDFYVNDDFYLRSLLCRKFVGDPLADALRLPYPPERRRRWKLRAKALLILWSVRFYTLATRYLPFARRYAVRLHVNAMVRFHERWSSTHGSQMARALRRRVRPSVADDHDDKDSASPPSCCPFAMVAPPT